MLMRAGVRMPTSRPCEDAHVSGLLVPLASAPKLIELQVRGTRGGCLHERAPVEVTEPRPLLDRVVDVFVGLLDRRRVVAVHEETACCNDQARVSDRTVIEGGRELALSVRRAWNVQPAATGFLAARGELGQPLRRRRARWSLRHSRPYRWRAMLAKISCRSARQTHFGQCRHLDVNVNARRGEAHSK